jgi:Domain of unknown function (DUF4338)
MKWWPGTERSELLRRAVSKTTPNVAQTPFIESTPAFTSGVYLNELVPKLALPSETDRTCRFRNASHRVSALLASGRRNPCLFRTPEEHPRHNGYRFWQDRDLPIDRIGKQRATCKSRAISAKVFPPALRRTRVSVPVRVLGSKGSAALRYQKLGSTQGYGTFQFSDDTVDALSKAYAQLRGGRRVNSIFGEGVSPRLRKVRDGLALLGLEPTSLLMHGSTRLIYAVPLCSNFREYLRGESDVPEYLIPFDNPMLSSKAIARYWSDRWLANRIQRDDVLEEVSRSDLSYPIQHGARVKLVEGPQPDLWFDGSR